MLLRRVVPLAFMVALTGCTADGDVAVRGNGKVIRCINVHTGELFTFNTNTARDIQVGVSGSLVSMTITTIRGEDMTLTSSMETVLECV
jgi:hypothetical protein